MRDSIQLELMLQLTQAVLTDAVHVIGQLDPWYSTETPRGIDALNDLKRLAALDFSYITNRAQKEGVSFFTKSLPLYGKRLDAYLSGSALETVGFKNRQSGSVLFGWLLFQEIERGDEGSSSHAPLKPVAVKILRQLTYMFYKYELPYSHEQEASVLDSFIKVERDLPDPSYLDGSPEDPILDLASRLVANICHRFSASEIIPKHGPGAVATGEKPWDKMRFARIYKSIEQYFPFTEWYVPSMSWVVDNLDKIQNLECLDSGTAKVVLVPKDSRGPRLISCEPLELQWIQQGISKQLVELIESHPFTSRRVNFTDQEVNRRHALWGSMGANWVTLDMKDASDRVSLYLVKALFGRTALLQYLLASRSTATRLPDGTVITMKKFAPMGSALCFPIEALCFWALAVSSLHLHQGLKLSRAMSCVKVYGDDIITTAESCAEVICTLERYHLAMNRSKCCIAGSFRESCGMDAYRGVDVTPTKIRSIYTSKPDCNTIVSWVALSNEFYLRGYYTVAEALESHVRGWLVAENRNKRHKWVIPTISDLKPRSYLCFARLHVTDGYKGVASRYNPVVQRTEVRALTSRPVCVSRKRPGMELMFKSLIEMEHRNGPCKGPSRSAPSGSVNVQSYPLRGRVTLQLRWCLK